MKELQLTSAQTQEFEIELLLKTNQFTVSFNLSMPKITIDVIFNNDETIKSKITEFIDCCLLVTIDKSIDIATITKMHIRVTLPPQNEQTMTIDKNFKIITIRHENYSYQNLYQNPYMYRSFQD